MKIGVRIINMCACIGLLLQPSFLDAKQRGGVNQAASLSAVQAKGEELPEQELVDHEAQKVESQNSIKLESVNSDSNSDKDISEQKKSKENLQELVTPEKTGLLETFYQKLPSFKLTYQSAVDILKQKAMCLYDYEHCTKRDLLAISYGLGFLSGYGISLYDSAYFYSMRKIYSTDVGRKIFSAKEVMDDFIRGSIGEFGLRMLYMEFFSNIIHPYLPSNIFTVGDFDPFARIIRMPRLFSMVVANNWEGLRNAEMEAFKNIASFGMHDSMAQEGRLLQIFVYVRYVFTFFTVLASSLVGIANELKYATTIADSKQSLIKNLWYYLKMNAKCIWNETYCETKNEKLREITQQAAQHNIPHGLAFNRRLGLFGMMGFASGILARSMQAKKFEARVPDNSIVYVEEDVAKELNIDPGFLEWYKIFGLSSENIQGAKGKYKDLALNYHPDKCKKSPKELCGKIFRLITEAKGNRW